MVENPMDGTEGTAGGMTLGPTSFLEMKFV
jgi:hypothetical protein